MNTSQIIKGDGQDNFYLRSITESYVFERFSYRYSCRNV